MIEADSSRLCQPHSSVELPNLLRMIAPPEVRQHEFLPPHTNPCGIWANVGLNGYGFSTLPERGPIIEADGMLGHYGPHVHTSPLTPTLFLNEKQVLLPTDLDGKASPSEVSSPQQKRYLIFDHSGNQTRLILGSLCSPKQNPTADFSKSHVAYKFPAQGHIVKSEQNLLEMPVLQEELGENHMVIEGSGIHEDTDEIDALLYSDDDDKSHNDEDDYNGEDGDEISTGHSPLTLKDKFQVQVEDITEEVASSNVFSKRRKAFDGGYTKLPPVNTTKTVQPFGPYPSYSDADFRCSLREEMGHLMGSKRSRTDKIRDTLKILQSIVPCSEGKDPVVILDKAINYLKCLKFEAEALFLEESESSKCLELN